MLSTGRDRPQRYTARLEVHLDQATQTTITRFVTAFRRRSAVLRQVLEWGLTHGQGWQVDRHRPSGRAERVSLRLEPELWEPVEAVATTAEVTSPWLRYAVQRVNVADFPASWQAASVEQERDPKRSDDCRTYARRLMLRLDDASACALDALVRHFDRSAAGIMRQLITQARPAQIPKSWHMAAAERPARRARQQGRAP